METNNRRAIWAILFMSGAMWGLDIYSAVNSSPWAASQAAADPIKEKSLRKYMNQAAASSIVFGAASSAISGSPWPLVGAAGTTAYMWWLYEDAIKYAKASGNEKGFRWNQS